VLYGSDDECNCYRLQNANVTWQTGKRFKSICCNFPQQDAGKAEAEIL